MFIATKTSIHGNCFMDKKRSPTSHHKVALALAGFGSLAPAPATAQPRKRIYHTQTWPLHMAEPCTLREEGHLYCNFFVSRKHWEVVKLQKFANDLFIRV